MKQLFIVAAVCLANQFNAIAQKARFGIQAGAAISNFTYKIDDFSLSANSKTGITAGILGDFPLSKSFSLQPAVNYVQYGSKGESADGIEGNEINVSSLEVPLNCMYNAPAGKGRVYIGAGPAISFNLSGNEKIFDGTSGNSEKKLEFGSDDNADMKMINLGANFIAGYCFNNGMFLSVNYNLGLSNLEPGSSDDGFLDVVSTKSHYFGVRVGYFIGGK